MRFLAFGLWRLVSSIWFGLVFISNISQKLRACCFSIMRVQQIAPLIQLLAILQPIAGISRLCSLSKKVILRPTQRSIRRLLALSLHYRLSSIKGVQFRFANWAPWQQIGPRKICWWQIGPRQIGPRQIGPLDNLDTANCIHRILMYTYWGKYVSWYWINSANNWGIYIFPNCWQNLYVS